MTNGKSHERIRLLLKSTTLRDLDGPLRTRFQNVSFEARQRRFSPITVDCGNVRFMRIFLGVHWRGICQSTLIFRAFGRSNDVKRVTQVLQCKVSFIRPIVVYLSVKIWPSLNARWKRLSAYAHTLSQSRVCVEQTSEVRSGGCQSREVMSVSVTVTNDVHVVFKLHTKCIVSHLHCCFVSTLETTFILQWWRCWVKGSCLCIRAGFTLNRALFRKKCGPQAPTIIGLLLPLYSSQYNFVARLPSHSHTKLSFHWQSTKFD